MAVLVEGGVRVLPQVGPAEHGLAREQGDGAEVAAHLEPLYAESSKRSRQFCPSSLIEAEYCRSSTLRKVAPPTLPKPPPCPDILATTPPLSLEERRVRSCTTV